MRIDRPLALAVDTFGPGGMGHGGPERSPRRGHRSCRCCTHRAPGGAACELWAPENVPVPVP